MTTTFLKPLTVAIAAASLVGCFSSSSSDGTGSMSLDITDAPVDSLKQVNITFTGVTLKPTNGERLTIELEEELTRNILDFQRGNAFSLLSDEEVPAGEYNFITLELNTDELTVVNDNDESHPLSIPGGEQQGLQLVSGFTVPQGGAADFTIDLDLREAIVNTPDGDFKLRRALRLVDNTEVGQIAGVVHSGPLKACADVDNYAGAVYVYEYEGDDFEPFDYSMEQSPLMSASVDFDGDDYSYVAAFLTEGDYTIAYTCDADDPEEEEELTFHGERNVTVVADDTKHKQEDFDAETE